MSNIKEYLTSVGKGIGSLVKGMEVTAKELVTPKVTECYPENRKTQHVPERFRACLELINDNGHHKCIGCGICQMNCPNGTIKLVTKMVDLPDGKKKRVLDKYMYNLGSCTFCMLCVTTCPQHALQFSNDFEQSVFSREALMKELNAGLQTPEPPKPKPIDPEMAAKIAAAKAKAAAAKAAKEAAGEGAAEAPKAEAPKTPGEAQKPQSENK